MEKPPAVEALPAVGRPRGADVTWRRVSAPAGHGYFVVGDAAAVIDPASSDGVLRGLVSGLLAGHLTAYVLEGAMSADTALDEYTAWIRNLFENRISRLSALYSEILPGWRTFPANVKPSANNPKDRESGK